MVRTKEHAGRRFLRVGPRTDVKRCRGGRLDFRMVKERRKGVDPFGRSFRA